MLAGRHANCHVGAVIHPIHISLARYHPWDRERWLQPANCISDEERQRALRFADGEPRQCYLATRIHVRNALTRFINGTIAADKWSFVSGEKGKPALSPQVLTSHPETAGLQFSISHSHGLTAIAITRGSAIGFDLEALHRANERPRDLAQRYFSAAEQASLEGLAGAQLQEQFLRVWTGKEAYLKARGLGVTIPLREFCVVTRDGIERQWQLWQTPMPEGYVGALCIRRSTAAADADLPPPPVSLETCPDLN